MRFYSQLCDVKRESEGCKMENGTSSHTSGEQVLPKLSELEINMHFNRSSDSGESDGGLDKDSYDDDFPLKEKQHALFSRSIKSTQAESPEKLTRKVRELSTESNKKLRDIIFPVMGYGENNPLRPRLRPHVPPKPGIKNEDTINTNANNLLITDPIVYQPKARATKFWKPEQESTSLCEESVDSTNLDQDIENKKDTMVFKTINGNLQAIPKEHEQNRNEMDARDSCMDGCGECCFEILSFI